MENIIIQGGLRPLYNKVKGAVWLLEATSGRTTEKEIKVTFTGVCVKEDGLVMVAIVRAWNDLEDPEIKARRIDEKGLLHTAKRVKIGNLEEKWGIALFQMEGIGITTKCEVGNFATDGSLMEGEAVMYVGHPGNLVWSLVPITVGFSCVDGVTVSDDNQTCEKFVYSPSSVTPPYRQLGHLYYLGFFRGMSTKEKQSYSYEMGRHPEIPVIQCNGLVECVDAGGPLFNRNGHIVGLLSFKFNCFSFAIHVSSLKQFLSSSLEYSKGKGKGKVKGKGKAISPKLIMDSAKRRKST